LNNTLSWHTTSHRKNSRYKWRHGTRDLWRHTAHSTYRNSSGRSCWRKCQSPWRPAGHRHGNHSWAEPSSQEPRY